MEAIFRRCLLSVQSVDLWRFYLNYIRRTHSGPNISADKKQEARSVIRTTFEYVLQHIGNDKDSGYIWGDYIFFIKSGEVSLIWIWLILNVGSAMRLFLDVEVFGRSGIIIKKHCSTK